MLIYILFWFIRVWGNVVDISLSEQFIHASVAENQLADFPCFTATGSLVMSCWRHGRSLTTSHLMRPAATNECAGDLIKTGSGPGSCIAAAIWRCHNGSTAFKWNRQWHWLVGLQQRQIIEVNTGSRPHWCYLKLSWIDLSIEHIFKVMSRCC